jgi:DNA-binding MarR family transcriptional regulator
LGTAYLLNRAELAVRGCVERLLQPHGLTPMQFLVLFSLSRQHSQSSAQLAREVGVRAQSMAEIIRPLERARLIVRRATPGAGRVLRIDVSAQGQALLDRCVPLAQRLERELLKNLRPGLLEALREGLETLRGNADAHGGRALPARRAGRSTHGER